MIEPEAVRYARSLLRGLGWGGLDPSPPRDSPVGAWARSGALWLTGLPGHVPVMPTAPLASCADGALAALETLAPGSALAGVDGAALLGERAAIFSLSRCGRISPGGSCRLMRCQDGWLAVNIPRSTEFWSLVPAWLEDPEAAQSWSALARSLSRQPGGNAVARAHLLGLAVAPVAPTQRPPPGWLQAQVSDVRAPPLGPPLVADLSSLWAGPLCGQLLAATGARVIKVESTRRPDGTRRGPRAFFDLLNAGKQNLALNFSDPQDRATLLAFLERVDVVLESARPRALLQLGLHAERWVAEREGRIWLSITGYGRSEPEALWTAFGDDAAAAAGLPFCVPAGQGPLFVGDAIADPLAGIHAALAVRSHWVRGQGGLLGVALRDVVAHGIGFRRPTQRASGTSSRVRRVGGRWRVGDYVIRPPRARRPTKPARTLGADNAELLRDPGPENRNLPDESRQET